MKDDDCSPTGAFVGGFTPGSSGVIDSEGNVHVFKKMTATMPMPSNVNNCKIQVYLDNGLVFEYFVANPNKGREHAHEIIKSGYRHTPEGTNDLEWFPPHRIVKIKVDGAGEANYKDTIRAT